MDPLFDDSTDSPRHPMLEDALIVLTPIILTLLGFWGEYRQSDGAPNEFIRGMTTMNNKHSVFDALGAMTLLVAAGTVAMLLFR